MKWMKVVHTLQDALAKVNVIEISHSTWWPENSANDYPLFYHDRNVCHICDTYSLNTVNLRKIKYDNNNNITKNKNCKRLLMTQTQHFSMSYDNAYELYWL